MAKLPQDPQDSQDSQDLQGSQDLRDSRNPLEPENSGPEKSDPQNSGPETSGPENNGPKPTKTRSRVNSRVNTWVNSSRGKNTAAVGRLKTVLRWVLILLVVAALLYLLWTRLAGWSALLWLLPMGMVLVASNLYYRRRPALQIKRVHDGFASVGSTLKVRLECSITAPLPLRLHFSDLPPRTLILGKSLELGGLFGGVQHHTLESEIKLDMRGEFVWPGFKVYWADPWGLFWWEMELPISSTLTVFPDQHAMMLPDMLRPLLADGKPGARIGLEDPSSLRGVREYQAGDALNRIHWRQTAKYAFTGVPMVRELERVSSASMHLHIDTRGSARFIESAVKLASSMVRLAEAEYQSIQISTATELSHFGRGKDTLISALSLLARVQHEPAASPHIPLPVFGANMIVITEHPRLELVESALKTRAKASRVLLLVMHEGFYLEPQERPRRIWAGLHESVKQLEQRAAILSEHGIRVFLLRGNQSVLELSGREG
jgi:uncharacterized protein (DUF58 family)